MIKNVENAMTELVKIYANIHQNRKPEKCDDNSAREELAILLAKYDELMLSIEGL